MNDWNKSEIIADLRYGYWYNTWNAKANQRIDFTLNFIQLFIGSSVVGSVAADIKPLSVTLALIATSLGIISALKGYGARKVLFHHAASEYNHALLEIESLDEQAAKKRLYSLQSAFERGYESADDLAHNSVCCMHQADEQKLQFKGPRKVWLILLYGHY